jgi:hypothetical protein
VERIQPQINFAKTTEIIFLSAGCFILAAIGGFLLFAAIKDDYSMLAFSAFAFKLTADSWNNYWEEEKANN